MFHVSIELWKHKCKFGRTRNAVGTWADRRVYPQLLLLTRCFLKEKKTKVCIEASCSGKFMINWFKVFFVVVGILSLQTELLILCNGAILHNQPHISVAQCEQSTCTKCILLFLFYLTFHMWFKSWGVLSIVLCIKDCLQCTCVEGFK